MNEEKHEQVVNAMVNFVIRVMNGETTSEKEIEILPEVVSALFNDYLALH